ncbi:D-alanine--D-alanine ligase family protein [Candidatus Tachikawaea gelatinosa]|uniref:D-alanine--D-alanine ligase n=1 Tax=Candidatus Tachikawaea gelatinosa TaxID=1410383 RepID=A0A090ALF9_9ENTR|nr:D-alanine--D-alanine ligase family protein [Candidatus Tachikawaea gelatinosa]BAP58474.1 D-alanine--D-alanine ligase [Candidatus Tachikawaea gelatinosa]
MKKLKVGIIFGGQSVEHNISLKSAVTIINFIDKKKFEVHLFKIDKDGFWFFFENFNDDNVNKKTLFLLKNSHFFKKIMFFPGKNKFFIVKDSLIEKKIPNMDIMFPITHGTFGEDGCLQGMLSFLKIPFVGTGVLGSAINMNKDVMKRILFHAGLKTASFITINNYELKNFNISQDFSHLGFPLFVKPNSQGSSIGISKVNSIVELKKAIDLAFQYDKKILIEKAINGREIECAVLGNHKLIVSVFGEIISKNRFYSYDEKYGNTKNIQLIIPAKITEKQKKILTNVIKKTFKVLECDDFARIDFFLKGEDTVVINEINTLPGFTKNSMYPNLWNFSDISYTDLITKIIYISLKRYQNNKV